MGMKPKPGRPRIGQPISITLTKEQREWVDSKITPGGSRTEVIRRLVHDRMEWDKGDEHICPACFADR